ncbi:nucleotidyltransferase family protein [Planktotalea sp.]|uniref:nucleotidyltransferase family protein n=1 Tax=Planktotalea sp. TaxID=2029877 RepID=UPI003D6B564F
MRVTLLPAAGASSRMRGGDKLLELVEGKPILEVLASRAIEAKSKVIITLPSPEHPRVAAIAHLDVTQIYVPNAHEGMSYSLRAGVAALPKNAEGLMILPADMPEITAQDISLAWARYDEKRPIALQCTTQSGARGHPIIFSPELVAKFDLLTGDRGAFSLLKEHETEVECVELQGERARLDLDTPEEWRAWRASL